MKICIINNLFEPFCRGGAEKVAKLVGDGLGMLDNEIFYITCKPKIGEIRYKKNKNRVYYLFSSYYYLSRLPKFFRLFWHVFNIFNLVNCFKVYFIFKKERPEVVVFNNLMGISFLVPWLARKMKIKSVLILHDLQLLHPSGLKIFGDEKKFLSRGAKTYASICNYLFSPINVVISPSSWLLNEYLNHGFFNNSITKVLPNPSEEIAGFVTKRRNNTNDRNKFKFLYVGQIEEHKGVFFLVNAFKKISKYISPSVELIIIGFGREFKRLETLVGDDPSIVIKGYKINSEINEIMNDCGCVIVPSLCYENSPSVIYEAFSQGIPVIASNHGGISELFRDQSMLFQPNNEGELISRIKYFINNYELISQSFEENREFNIINKKKYASSLLKFLA